MKIESYLELGLYRYLLPLVFSELGTRQYCRDNVTMFLGHKVVILISVLVILYLFVVATPSRLRDLNIFLFFSGL